MPNNNSIARLEREIAELKKLLSEKEKQLSDLRPTTLDNINPVNKLTNDDIARYSRQIIIPEFGVRGQLLLKKASVLIVGAGGLGCPAALYLAGAGVGCLGIVDYDEVEINNLHRQLLHTEEKLGSPKVESAASSLNRLNSHIAIVEHNVQLDSNNALDIIAAYDIILDCTDNVATRYLLNDACVILNRPLVSGSAIQMEGQLTVYHYDNGPCYRCLFPKPPPPETVTNCGDGGVLGAVPGVIGVLQSIETIKIILKTPGVLSSRMMLYDANQAVFRTVKLRGPQPSCEVCSENAVIRELIDYEQFCCSKATDKDPKLQILGPEERVSPKEYSAVKEEHILIDVRAPAEFEICRLKTSINVPIKDILDNKKTDEIKNMIDLLYTNSDLPVFVVCRRGNDSQRAVRHLRDALGEKVRTRFVDLIGGLHAWARDVDNTFPVY